MRRQKMLKPFGAVWQRKRAPVVVCHLNQPLRRMLAFVAKTPAPAKLVGGDRRSLGEPVQRFQCRFVEGWAAHSRTLAEISRCRSARTCAYFSGSARCISSSARRLRYFFRSRLPQLEQTTVSAISPESAIARNVQSGKTWPQPKFSVGQTIILSGTPITSSSSQSRQRHHDLRRSAREVLD